MRKKPPAFDLYPKDWLTSPTVNKMPLKDRGIYIHLLCASWEQEEPGTLPLPLEICARCAGLDIRLVKHFLHKYETSFVEIEGKLVNVKLHNQWLKYLEISGKRADAAKQSHAANAAQMQSKPNAFFPSPSLIKKKEQKNLPREARDLALTLKSEIQKNDPDIRIKESQIDKWAEDADKMMRLDGISEESIRSVIIWSQHDDFWASNILSMGKLRKQYPQLKMKMTRINGNGNGNSTRDKLEQALERAFANDPICRGDDEPLRLEGGGNRRIRKAFEEVGLFPRDSDRKIH